MISGLPRPAIAGSASCAPASASLRMSGIGLISVFIGKKPETIVPAHLNRKRARRNRLRRSLALRGRQRVALGQRLGAKGGFWWLRFRSNPASIKSAEPRRPSEYDPGNLHK